MVEHKKVKLLAERDDLMEQDCVARGYKNGIEIEKGVVATEDFLKRNWDLL